MRNEMREKYGSGPLHDMPHDATLTSHHMQHGDVVVLATDGVWDNLNQHEILQIVVAEMHRFRVLVNGDVGVELSDLIHDRVARNSSIHADAILQTALAARIVHEAKTASQDRTRDGPFAREVQKYYPGDDWHGGKVDDICVVVAVATFA